MFDPADLELVRHISLTYELELVRASFNVMCRSLDLPLISGSLYDFESRQIRLLATTLFHGLLSALPANSALRVSLSVLASSMMTSSDAVGCNATNRIILLIEAAIHATDTMLVWDLEIQGCTFLHVQGFFEKYFEAKDLTELAQDVYTLLKEQHVNNMWTFLRASPSMTEMMRWLDFLQDDILKVEHRRFWETNLPSELTEGIKGGRLDVCVKRKSGPRSPAMSGWEDLLAIGQLTAERDTKKRLTELACYARNLFDFQPTRRYLHAFTICGSMLEPWVFDRSGCYSPGAFDIHQNPERFIRVITGYIMMSEDVLGLDTFVQREGRSGFIDIVGPAGEQKKLYLSPTLLDHRPTIASRATSCFLAKHADSSDHDHVVKFSWPLYHQSSEVDVFKLAKQRGVQGIVSMVTHFEITTVNEMRRGMTFGKRYAFDDTASAMPAPSQPLLPSQPLSTKRSRSPDSSSSQSKKRKSTSTNEALHLRRPEGNTQLPGRQNEVAPKEDRRNAIKAHQSLYVDGKMLHQDISENNIIITDVKKTGFSGMLIDFDLVREIDKEPFKPGTRTGTKEFMAIRVLRGIEHTYRHDLESFFYVLLWQFIVRGWQFVGRRNPVAFSALNGWRASSSFEHLARNKQANMDKECFEAVLAEFPPEFQRIKPLCRTLRSILFPMKDGALFTGTPSDPDTLYLPILAAFDEIIARGRKGIEEARNEGQGGA
ncbi:hypothetical protein V8C44DRAFT_369186 [Trichoderma aethiopicum]